MSEMSQIYIYISLLVLHRRHHVEFNNEFVMEKSNWIDEIPHKWPKLFASCATLLTNRWNFPPPTYIIKPRTFSPGNIQIPFNNAQLHSCPSKVYGGSRSRCSGPELTHRYKVSAGNPITTYYGKVLENGFTVEVSKNVNRSIGHTAEISGGFVRIDPFQLSEMKSKSP